MAAKRITQSSIDWTRFAQLVPKSERHMFIAFKAKSDAYLRRMLSYPESAPPIDWSAYRKNITEKSVVDQLENAYKVLSIPYPKDTISHEIDAQQADNVKDIEQFCKESLLKIVEAKKMKEKFELMIPYDEITEEEFTLTFPDWSVRWQDPSVWPHEEKAPGLTKEQQEKLRAPDGPPFSLP